VIVKGREISFKVRREKGENTPERRSVKRGGKKFKYQPDLLGGTRSWRSLKGKRKGGFGGGE